MALENIGNGLSAELVAEISKGAARFLLKPGRRYEDAVKTFQPYDRTKEVDDEARKPGRR